MVTFELLGLYVAFSGSVIFVLLFGGLPAFQGTPLGRLHWLVTEASCNAAWSTLQRIAGDNAAQSCESLLDKHCSSTSPFLQILYVLLLAGGYFLYCRDIFCFLPQPFAPLWHQYTGAASLGACLAAFAVACMSDPGVITSENYKQHVTLYAYDGALYRGDQQCLVCNWKRPARSRHCDITRRCVARYDHYCPWIRRTIGILNLRWFILFLVSNIFLCSYGAVLGWVIMQRVAGQRAQYVMFKEPATGHLLPVSSQPSIMLRWAVQKYPVQVALIIFLTVALILVSAFFAYHLCLILCGMTSYESYKWSLLYKSLSAEQEAEGSSSAGSGAAGGADGPRRASCWSTNVGLVRVKKVKFMPVNSYDRGQMRNLQDALAPPAWASHSGGAKLKQT